MKPGEVLETAIWLDGTETTELIARYKEDCHECIRLAADEHKVLFSPIEFTEKKPGEDRVPPVPGHIHGPDVRLLIAEAMVLCHAPQIITRSFLMDLDPKDLERLRQITRRVHAKDRPRGALLTDAQCDAIIEEIGPQAAYETVRKAVDDRVLH